MCWRTLPGGNPEVILIGTGSEVALCVEAYEQLSKEGVRARVVSMPSWELFDDQDQDVPGIRSAPTRESASLRGGRIRFRLEQVHRLRRPQRLYRKLWGIGASQATAEEVRLQRGKHCSRGEEPDCRDSELGAEQEHDMKVGIGADHGGFEMKQQLAKLACAGRPRGGRFWQQSI